MRVGAGNLGSGIANDQSTCQSYIWAVLRHRHASCSGAAVTGRSHVTHSDKSVVIFATAPAKALPV